MQGIGDKYPFGSNKRAKTESLTNFRVTPKSDESQMTCVTSSSIMDLYTAFPVLSIEAIFSLLSPILRAVGGAI